MSMKSWLHEYYQFYIKISTFVIHWVTMWKKLVAADVTKLKQIFHVFAYKWIIKGYEGISI